MDALVQLMEKVKIKASACVAVVTEVSPVAMGKPALGLAISIPVSQGVLIKGRLCSAGFQDPTVHRLVTAVICLQWILPAYSGNKSQ